ncbi:MAG: hypothetical protein EXQ56_11680, partial [Acidobacteria bacterium]|nr:hypothetical protein [Acidobacteriota bacterium]
ARPPLGRPPPRRLAGHRPDGHHHRRPAGPAQAHGLAVARARGARITGGAAIGGILLFGEPATAPRLACMALIIAGIVGLKLIPIS